MNGADRLINLCLFVLAAVAWVGVAYVFTTLDPRGDSAVLLAGALLLGAGLSLTLAPMLWLANFVRLGQIAYRGDWLRSIRRAGLAGLVVVLFVVLRAQDALSQPLAIFIVAMAVLVELTLSLRH